MSNLYDKKFEKIFNQVKVYTLPHSKKERTMQSWIEIQVRIISLLSRESESDIRNKLSEEQILQMLNNKTIFEWNIDDLLECSQDDLDAIIRDIKLKTILNHKL